MTIKNKTTALIPFIHLYEHFSSENKKPMDVAQCPIAQVYPYGISEYLFDELCSTVKQYRSDFIMHLVDIFQSINALQPNETVMFPIAFRENGVDGPEFLCLRLKDNLYDFYQTYRAKKIFLLVCSAKDTKVEVNLYSIYDDIIHHVDEFIKDIDNIK